MTGQRPGGVFCPVQDFRPVLYKEETTGRPPDCVSVGRPPKQFYLLTPFGLIGSLPFDFFTLYQPTYGSCSDRGLTRPSSVTDVVLSV